MIKYIIFDFDGTLADSQEVGISAANRLAEKHKFKKIEQKDIQHLKNLSVTEKFKFLNFPLYKIPFWSAEFYNLYKQSIKEIVLFNGMEEVLEELHNTGYHIAIISSNSEHNIREFLQNNQIDYIKEIFCSNKIFGKDKIIRKFLKMYMLKECEVIYIGDELRDIMACKKSGIRVIWVGWGYDIIEMVKKEDPNYMVNKPEEILNIVYRLNNQQSALNSF
ncbi:MAG: HAD-IA family hydrolase [Clostridia bacterium]